MNRQYHRNRLAIPTLMLGMLISNAASAHDQHDHAPSATDNAGPRAARTIKWLEDRIASNPLDQISLSKLGALRLESARRTSEHDEFVAAEHAFQGALRIDGESKSSRIGLAYALLGQHKFREALAIARQVAESMPESPQIWQLLGDLHLALGHYVEAEIVFTRLVAHELTLQSMSRMAQIHELRGRHDEAVRWMTDALKAGRLLDEPSAAQAWCLTMLGDIALRTGQTDLARAQYRSALDLDERAHVAEFRLAEQAGKHGDVEQAEQTLRKLIEQFSKPAYKIALGDLLALDGNPSEAESWFAKNVCEKASLCRYVWV